MMDPFRRGRVSACLIATCLLLLVLSSLSAAESADSEPPSIPGPLQTSTACAHTEPVRLVELEMGVEDVLLEQCPGIRPGARLTTGCTMNFLFEDDNDYYMGTAGHCTSHVGQRMGAAGIGAFGSVVYRINEGVGQDFALIRVDADKHNMVDPTLCAWAGPYDSDPLTHPGQPLHMYGWGVATNDASFTRARSGVLLSTSPTSITFLGVASGGDSGSPTVNALGSAVAVNTHVLLTAQGSAVVYGTHIDHALRLADGAGFDVDVVAGGSII